MPLGLYYLTMNQTSPSYATLLIISLFVVHYPAVMPFKTLLAATDFNYVNCGPAISRYCCTIFLSCWYVVEDSTLFHSFILTTFIHGKSLSFHFNSESDILSDVDDNVSPSNVLDPE